MKILFYTDIHFRYNGDFFKISKNGHSNLLDHTCDALKFVIEQIERHKPDIVVCGGDIYHSMNSLDSHTVTTSFSILKRLCECCNSVNAMHYILLGNHDFISENREVSVIDFLNSYTNTFVIKDLLKLGNLVFCPYYFSKEKFSLPESVLVNKEDSIFFGHLSLKGGYYKYFKKSNQSLEESENVDLTTQVKSFGLVFNGHHHIPQILGNIVFPGSLLQVNIDEPELAIQRGIYIIDSETLDFTLIPNKISPKLVRVYSRYDLDKLSDNSYVYYAANTSEEINEVQIELKRFLGYRTEKLVSIKKDKQKDVVKFTSLTNNELFEHYLKNIDIKSNVEDLLLYGKGCINEAGSSLN